MTNEQLCALAKQGDADAQNLLIENNLRFIKKTAYEVWSAQAELNRALRIALDDLVQERIDDLHHALYMIEDREEQYLRYRFGFDDDMEHPLTETARHFHLSESRAKKTEALALDNVWLELPWWY